MTLRQAPARFFDGAPAIVKAQVLDLIEIKPAAPLDYDVILRAQNEDEHFGLDFGAHGSQGQHFHLRTHEMRDYRARHRRHRVAWRDLPEATQRAIVRYLESEE